MTPRIIDPMPSGRPLPIMNSMDDAVQISRQERNNFYVSAFLFQCWLCELSLQYAAELAEKPDPNDRSFQSGQAWRGFQKYFSKAFDADLPLLFSHLMQFGDHEDPFAAEVREAAFCLSVEHELTGQFLGPSTPRRLAEEPGKMLALIRSTIIRLCEWLDSVRHFRLLQEWHIMPECFDPDPQKRELTYLGINNRGFALMDEHAQMRCLNHTSDVLEELKDPSNRAIFNRALSSPPREPRPWPTHELDRALTCLWPLFSRYRWSATQLLFVLRKVLPPEQLAACPDEAALASYCADTLGLRNPGLRSRSQIGPEPPALNIALRLCAQLTEAMAFGKVR